ncbi:MAG TPA: hypothetical protein VF493_05830 [Terriglobales bacterium]
MKKFLISMCAVILTVSIAVAQHDHAHPSATDVMHTHHPTGDSDGTPGVIVGYVRDVACLLRNSKAGAATTALTQDCMKKCVSGGSPIGILTEDGSLYTAISDLIPDKDVRSHMLPYVGKYVRASGRLFKRGGLDAISIEKIEAIDRPGDSKIPTL